MRGGCIHSLVCVVRLCSCVYCVRCVPFCLLSFLKRVAAIAVRGLQLFADAACPGARISPW
jgi:hypothetical protein